MATLSGNKIKNTYQSLVKFSDNGNITVGAKQLTDGFGNNSPMFVSTTQVGIGVTPESGLNLHVFGDAKIGSNLTVIGNLVVEGSTTTVGTDTLTVKDPLIVLANNNTSTDAVDIGFYGKYTPSGTTLYSGLFREALTGKYRLFKGLETEPTTTVNTSGTGYARADLVIGDLEAERGTFTDSIFVSPSLYVSDAILHTGDIDTKLEFLSDQIKFSTGGSFRLSINNSYSEFFTNVRFEDGIKAQFGDNQDLEIYHDGSNSYITDTGTGDLRIQGSNQIRLSTANGNENYFVGIDNAQVELFYAGSKKFETMSTGVHITGVVISDGLDLGNNDKIRLGDSQDLEIYHNGTTGYIVNTRPSGDLYFRNETGSMVFQIQDSGTYASYIILRSTGGIQIDEDTKFTDNVKASFGDSNDLEIYHDGTNASFISNTNTTLPLQIFTDDLDIKSYSLQNNMIIANSGGAVQLYYGGSLKLSTSSTGIQVLGDLTATNGVHLADNVKASFGGSDDLEIYHNGTHSYIDNNTGDIIIRNDAADKGISFLADDGAGGSENYVYIDGGAFQTKFYKDTKHLDSVKAFFGTGNDLEIYHNGTSASIRNNTGDILISALEADSNIKFYTDNGTGTTVSNLEISGSTGTVSLKYYGSQKLYTTSTGVSITGRISQLTDPSAAQDAATKAYVDLQVGNNNELSEVLANGNTTGGTDIAITAGDDITFTDTSKILMGAGNDLQIYHDGGNSFINDTGTGALLLKSNGSGVYIKTIAGDTQAQFLNDGAVNLYYDNSLKLATTSYGISVTGAINADNYINIEGGTNPYLRIQDTTNEEYLNLYSSDNESAIVYTQDTFKISSGIDFLNQTPRLTIDSSGNATFTGDVGVGGASTFTSGTNVEVIDSTIARLGFTNDSTNGHQFAWYAGTTGNAVLYDYTDSVPLLSFTGGNQLFYGKIRVRDNGGTTNIIELNPNGNSYLNGGNVGIGTSSPDYELDVVGSIKASVQSRFANGSASTPAYSFDADSDTGIYRVTTNALGFSTAGTNSLTIDYYKAAFAGDIELNGANKYIYFRTATDSGLWQEYNFSLRFGTNNAERMRIDSSGRVGIGTDSPAAPLDVNGNVYIRETGVLYVNTLSGYTSNVITLNSNTNFIVPSGNVGIGTTSPDFKLSLNGGMRIENTSPSPNTGSGTEYGYNTSANEAFQITRTKGVGTSTYRPFIHRAEYISFQTGTTSSTERMRIESNGNVQLQTVGAQLRFQNSAGAAPYIKNSGEDASTAPYGQNLEFYTGGSKRLTIDSSGNATFAGSVTAPSGTITGSLTTNGLLVNTSASGNAKIVAVDQAYARLAIDNVNGQEWNLIAGAAGASNSGFGIYNADSGQTALQIDSSGNVNITSGDLGIGTTSPAKKLHVKESTTATYAAYIENSIAGGDYLAMIGDAGDNVFEFDSGGTGGEAQMKMYSDGVLKNLLDANGSSYFTGKVGIGTTSPTYGKITVTESGSAYTGDYIYGGTNGSYGALRCTLSASNSPSFIDFFRSSYSTTVPVGAIVTSGSNCLYQSYSDYRMKENVSELTGALDKVNNIQPKTFNYKEDTETTYQGFIAHELQEVVPQAVSGKKDEVNEDGTPKYQGVDNSHIVPLLVGAIQELKAEIELLKTQINK